MVVKLVEISEELGVGSHKKYVLREVFVNPEHVICLRPDDRAKRKLLENKLPSELDTRQEFTCIQMSSGHGGFNITVVGNPSIVEEKLRHNRKVLRG
jgi:hypothetical protein|tara:strand:+ start:891 stop:1181 length:291 start_codon:yes stop_codon:yes gene_type:complete